VRDPLEAYDFATARASLIPHFERCAAWINHAAPHSTRVETGDPDALTLHETPDGSAYAWWYPASPRPVGDHDIIGDPVPVVHEALLQYMRRARSELG
jgi:hypothetical protein